MKKIKSVFLVVALVCSFSIESFAIATEASSSISSNKSYSEVIVQAIENEQAIPSCDLEKAYLEGECTKQETIHNDDFGNPEYKMDIYSVQTENENSGITKSQVTVISLPVPVEETLQNGSADSIKLFSSVAKTQWDDSMGIKCYNNINYNSIPDGLNPGVTKYKLTSANGYWTVEDSTLQIYDNKIYYGNVDNAGGSNGSESIQTFSWNKTFNYTNWVSDIPAMLGGCGCNSYCKVRVRGTTDYWEFQCLNSVVCNFIPPLG